MNRFVIPILATLALSGCNTIPAEIATVGIGSTVTPQQVIVAANAFDAIESAATVYIGSPGADPTAVQQLVIAIRTGRHARNNLEAAINQNGKIVSVSGYRVLTIAINTLNNIFAQYNIARI